MKYVTILQQVKLKRKKKCKLILKYCSIRHIITHFFLHLTLYCLLSDQLKKKKSTYNNISWQIICFTTVYVLHSFFIIWIFTSQFRISEEGVKQRKSCCSVKSNKSIKDQHHPPYNETNSTSFPRDFHGTEGYADRIIYFFLFNKAL